MAAELRPLTDADPAALAALLGARHDRHRASEPLLAPADAAAEIADLLGRERLSGAVAARGGWRGARWAGPGPAGCARRGSGAPTPGSRTALRPPPPGS